MKASSRISRLEDGRIVKLGKSEILEFVDGKWEKPSKPVYGEDHMNSRPLSDDEFKSLLKSTSN